MKRLCAIVGCCLLAFQLGAAQPPLDQPTPQETPLPIRPPLVKKVVLKGDWQKTGRAELVFQTDDTSRVETIQMKAASSDTWFAELEFDPETLKAGSAALRGQTALSSSARAFCELRMEEGEHQLAAGLEGSIFGRDKLRLRTEESLTELVDSLTQVDYEIPLSDTGKLGLRAVRQGERNELTGRFHQDSGLGWEWGADVKTRVGPGESGLLPSLRAPEIQGNLRWAW